MARLGCVPTIRDYARQFPTEQFLCLPGARISVGPPQAAHRQLVW